MLKKPIFFVSFENIFSYKIESHNVIFIKDELLNEVFESKLIQTKKIIMIIT